MSNCTTKIISFLTILSHLMLFKENTSVYEEKVFTPKLKTCFHMGVPGFFWAASFRNILAENYAVASMRFLNY